MQEGWRFDRRLFLAAKSAVDLKAACQRLQARFRLHEFVSDVEVEGQDFWRYVHAASETLAFNLTEIGRFVSPSRWGWMWGAPDQANYQIIFYWASSQLGGPCIQEIIGELSEVFEAEVVPYPD